MKSNTRSRVICAVATFCSVLALSHIGSAAVKAKLPSKTFKVGRVTFEGTPKTICIIRGRWADGESLRYEAWDECSEMTLRHIAASEYRNAPSLGEGDTGVKDTPTGAEVFEISNQYSSVLLFRDKKGVKRTIMTGD